MAVVLVLTFVIFCSVYFTVKIDVNKKILAFFQSEGDLEYQDMTIGQSIINTLFNANRIKGISSIFKGEQYIVPYGKMINVNGKWYKADADISTEIYRKIDEIIALRKDA